MTRRLILPKVASVLAALAIFAAAPAFAQTATTTTTLSAALTAGATTFGVASATGIAAGSELWFADTSEAVTVASISGTTVTAYQRGVDGTKAASHPAGVLIAASTANSLNSPFIHGSPTGSPSGDSCTRTAQPLLPLVDLDTGTMWDCTLDITTANTLVASGTVNSTAGRWRGTTLISADQSIMPRQVVVNADYQIKPWDYLVAVTSLTTGTLGGHNLTLPSVTGMIGKTLIIKDESGFIISTGPVLTVVGTIDGATNVVISAAYSVMRLYSNGVNWQRW